MVLLALFQLKKKKKRQSCDYVFLDTVKWEVQWSMQNRTTLPHWTTFFWGEAFFKFIFHTWQEARELIGHHSPSTHKRKFTIITHIWSLELPLYPHIFFFLLTGLKGVQIPPLQTSRYTPPSLLCSWPLFLNIWPPHEHNTIRDHCVTSLPSNNTWKSQHTETWSPINPYGLRNTYEYRPVFFFFTFAWSTRATLNWKSTSPAYHGPQSTKLLGELINISNGPEKSC